MKKFFIIIITSFVVTSSAYAINNFRANEPELIYVVDTIDCWELDPIVRDSTGHAFLINDTAGDMFMTSYNGEGIEYFMKHPDNAYIFFPDLLESLTTGYNNSDGYNDYISRYFAWHKDWLRKTFDKYMFSEPPIKYPKPLNKKLSGKIEIYRYPQEQGPDYYLLVLVRGDFYNYLAVTNYSCGGPTAILHFSDPKAYYKVVVPIWDKLE